MKRDRLPKWTPPIDRVTDKADAEYHHAVKRARERYGVDLRQPDYDRLVKAIQTNRAQFVERQSNRVSLWVVRHAETPMVAVYDTHRHMIVTFLPFAPDPEPTTEPLSYADAETIRTWIQTNHPRTKFIDRESNRLSRWWIAYPWYEGGVWVRYDRHRHTVERIPNPRDAESPASDESRLE